jgi:glutaredoxin
MEITVYSTNTCGQCKMFKNKLEQKNIVYTEVQDEKKAIELGQANNIYTLPILEIDGVIYNTISAAKKIGL